MKIEYNNLYTHFIFTTFERACVITEKIRNRIEKYITGIVNHNSCKLYAIYANPEHVHFLISRTPQISEEQIATIVEESSERFINQNDFMQCHFSWQKSASAFSVSKSDIDKVCKYILNQAEHHKRATFEDEYVQFNKHYQGTIKNKVIR